MSATTERHLLPGQFYGNVVNKRSCCGLVLSELKHASPKKLAEHSHQLANFCLLIKGGYREYVGSRLIEYKPLTLIFHPPEFTHRDEIGNQGGHFFNVELDARWMRHLGEYSSVPDKPVDGPDLTWLALKLYREFKAPHAYSDLGIQGLVMQMLAALTRARITDEKRQPKWLTRAVDLLHSDFNNHNLTINSVAAEVGVHPFHLSKVFKHFHQQTIGDYVKNLKVRFACRELSKPGSDLASVALAAGFADQSHFTRIFKQVTGMTPGAFRGTATNHQG